MNESLAFHVLVVDDDARLRALIGRYLEEQGFLVTAAQDAAAARAAMERMAFDAMVLDVTMPGPDGVELTAALRAEGQMIPIILLTARGEPDDRIRGLEAGADDYLSKPFEPRELVLRLSAILRRLGPSVSAEAVPVATFGGWHFDARRESLTRGDQTVRLTAGEAGLLRTLMDSLGVPVSRDQLAERSGQLVNVRTIDVQVTRLRRKIEADPRQPRTLLTMRGEGYVLLPDDTAM